MQLQNARAIVTGAASGLGQHFAVQLAAAGALVAAGDIDVKGLERLTELTKGSAGKVWTGKLDVSQEASVTAFVKEASQNFGGINLLINDAGILRDGLLVTQEGTWTKKLPTAQWKQVLDVNLTGTYLCCRQVIAGMLERGFGRVVNVASTAGITGYAYVSAYCAAKHGVIGLTRALALETAARNVTVNAVCPGYTDTDMAGAAVANIVRKTGKSEAEARTALTSRNPQQRLVRPQEVANAVLWLCLPGAEAITGQAIAVAGGEVL